MYTISKKVGNKTKEMQLDRSLKHLYVNENYKKFDVIVVFFKIMIHWNSVSFLLFLIKTNSKHWEYQYSKFNG